MKCSLLIRWELYLHLLQQIVTDENLEAAFVWLCQQRKDYSHNDDVWRVRQDWPNIKDRLRRELLAGCYRFSALRRVHGDEGDLDIWTALDALVLKAIALVLTQYLAPRLSTQCHHLAGNGGAKAAVRRVTENLAGNKFVFRTDVHSYYASIRHDILLDRLRQHIDDPRLLDLLWQYMRRTVYDDGHYEDIQQGISLGCSLSPLMGALFLEELDRRVEETGLFYARFMDDWVILAPSRWKLRTVIALVNKTMTKLLVTKHPDKTFIGRISSGFDFLGYRFAAGQVSVNETAIRKFAARRNRLYEQGATMVRIGDYARRWIRWATAGGFREVLFTGTSVGGNDLWRTSMHASMASFHTALACTNN